jgi:hypothetical protein
MLRTWITRKLIGVLYKVAEGSIEKTTTTRHTGIPIR